MLGYSEAAYEAVVTSGAAGTIPAAAGVRPPVQPVAERLHDDRWRYGRLKEHDPAFKERLAGRFGPAFGRASQSDPK
jgi:hypothetical protein